MRSVPRFLVLTIVALLDPRVVGLNTASAAPTTAAAGPQFMRIVDSGKQASLESAIVTYRNGDGASVALISAVHIGEKSYYESLNQAFDKFEAVLYEMVKPKDAPMPSTTQRADGPQHPIARLQQFLKNVLGLEYQLDAIDYGKKHFVHADLDAETFARLQRERGESLASLMLKSIMDALRNPEKARPALGPAFLDEAVDALTKPDMERRLRRMLARSMGDVEATAAAFGQNSVILDERNKAALGALKQTLAKGHKNVAIFYGAAHMPDLGRRLQEMGFKQESCEYLTAWDLTIRPEAPSAVDKLLDSTQKLLEKLLK
jgi:hypothetical protein